MPLLYDSALTLKQYSREVYETDRFSDDDKNAKKDKFAYGFFGEVGSLLSALKKVSRDALHETEAEVACEELGDALWYLIAIANTCDMNLQSLGQNCINFLSQRFEERDLTLESEIDFRQIDALLDIHKHRFKDSRDLLLREFATDSGAVLDYAENQRKLNDKTIEETLSHLLAMLGLVCASFKLKIEVVAVKNKQKIKDRWPGLNPVYVELFDSDFPDHEQLPRKISIEFVERNSKEGSYVVQRLSGVNIGDRLTDNISISDDYRFHDIFHLAYMAHLGWSPVIRALLKVKRKSKSEVDENQDGARAIIIEEGIATWIFNHAKQRDFYEGISEGSLEYALLKQIKNMVLGYEVEKCPSWQWERAILDGFNVFREIRKKENRGGVVNIDMHEHTINFVPDT